MIVSSCLARSSRDAWACGTMIETVCEASGAGASSASIRLTSDRSPLVPRVTRNSTTISTRRERSVYGRGWGLSGPGSIGPLGPLGSIGTVGGTGVLVMRFEHRQAVRPSAAKRNADALPPRGLLCGFPTGGNVTRGTGFTVTARSAADSRLGKKSRTSAARQRSPAAGDHGRRAGRWRTNAVRTGPQVGRCAGGSGLAGGDGLRQLLGRGRRDGHQLRDGGTGQFR